MAVLLHTGIVLLTCYKFRASLVKKRENSLEGER